MPAATAQPIQVLVVEATDAVRTFLAQRLALDPQLRVADAVGDAQAALGFLRRHSADVVLMGHRLPALDGFETTRRIMETRPLPIVVCAAASEGDAVFRSMEAGAVACIEKPMPETPNEAAVANMVQTVRLMSEVKVVRRWVPGAVAQHSAHRHSRSGVPESWRIVGIGSSTGGPPVLQTILAALPAHFPIPVLVVQHIAKGFLEGMADWLRQTSGLKVQIAAYGIRPLPGHVYLAPDDFQMGIGSDGSIALSRPCPEHCLCPSVDFLFGSLADTCGSQAIGVLLTGMGKDGAAELKRLKDIGAMTIAQDKASSTVHGMPGEAIKLGAAVHVLPPDLIAEKLIALAAQPGGVPRN